MNVYHAFLTSNRDHIDLLSLQYSMSIMSRNWLNFIDVNVFVRSSTIMRLIKIYFTNIFFSSIASRTQCHLASICFVRRWNSRFSSSAIVSWLSTQMTVRILKIACNCRSRKRNQIAFFLVSLRATYFDSQLDWVTRFWRLELHEIESFDMKNI